MTEERFWELVTLQLSGEASAAELNELEVALAADAGLRLRYAGFKSLWAKPAPSSDEKKQTAYDKHLQRLSNQISGAGLQYDTTPSIIGPESAKTTPSRVRPIAWVSGIAAALVVGWAVLFFIPGRKQQLAQQAQNTVSTKRGSKSKIQLPDGTQVWLNADSKITYNENFQGKVREVNLSGEAFFDVTRDESRPFVIHTQIIDVKVLGTSFNVRSYADEANTETSLIHGSVEITIRNSPEKKFTLKPNDKLIVSNDEASGTSRKTATADKSKQILLTWGKIRFKDADTSAVETMWVKNKLVFDDESLAEIAAKLERWYDIKVNITDDTIKEGKYSGIFMDETVEQVMDALKTTGKFKFSINKKELTIRP